MQNEPEWHFWKHLNNLTYKINVLWCEISHLECEISHLDVSSGIARLFHILKYPVWSSVGNSILNFRFHIWGDLDTLISYEVPFSKII